jgi:phosphate/sulfate permease
VSSQYELAHTMRLGRWKLWIGGSGQVKFVDGKDDPREEKDLTEEQPVARRFVSDAMGLWMAYQEKWKKARWGVASNIFIAWVLTVPISAAVSFGMYYLLHALFPVV